MERPENNNFSLVDNTLTDTVSSLKWGPNSTLLAASSWDGKIRIWDVKESYPGNIVAQPRLMTDMSNPVLQISWNREGTMIFAGCGDNLIKAWDLNQNKVVNIGQRQMPVAQVHWCDNMNVLYAMSWDRSITIWDCKQQNPAMTTTLDIKPHYMSVAYPLMAVATANKRIYAFDLNRLRQGSFQAITNTESLLKYTTKSIAAYQNGWVLGSIEGRCEIRVLDFTNPTYSLANKGPNFTFKAHRDKEIFPVNSISFNPQFGTFVTGGGDGRLYIWDKDSKMKLKGFSDSKNFSSNKSYPASTILPIVETAFNSQGNVLAVAYGYDWSRGVNEYEDLKNEVLVHVCARSEVEKKNVRK